MSSSRVCIANSGSISGKYFLASFSAMGSMHWFTFSKIIAFKKHPLFRVSLAKQIVYSVKFWCSWRPGGKSIFAISSSLDSHPLLIPLPFHFPFQHEDFLGLRPYSPPPNLICRICFCLICLFCFSSELIVFPGFMWTWFFFFRASLNVSEIKEIEQVK